MATLEQIQAKLKKLQAQAEVMLAKKAQTAVDKIRVLMLEHGLTTADIEAKAKVTREGKTLREDALSKEKVVTGVKAKGAPKYRHPKTGATWSGRGRAPAWIADAKDRTKFLIASLADTVVAVSETTAGKTKATAKKPMVTTRAVARKGQPKGPQPAMYRDPKSGATWSGRGRAPAWLGADRSKFLIDGVVAESKETGAGAAAKPKVARVIKAVAKKGAAKKVVAKKAATKTVATAKKSTATKVPAAKAATAPTAKKAVAKKASGRKAAAKKVVAAAEVAPVPVVPAAEATA
ncbi:H-NS family nucleoid-associated regulatory protein [Paraburkholderia sp.]|uniref:H-NS family nucleoid-associated regulatory protein n=1 Tax=Paraburkholderia sp. TaxID=1926495 RepID=UPI003C7B6648